MKSHYCKNCEQVTMHKKDIGIGTLLLTLITGGLWLFLILFYQSRCWICGTPLWENETH